MESIATFSSIGLLTSAAALALLLLSLAVGAWLQAFVSRRIAGWGYKRALRGRLWLLYFAAAAPLWMLYSLLWAGGSALAALVVLLVGAAPLLRHFVRAAPLPPAADAGTGGEPLSWSECLVVSSGSMLGLLLVATVLAIVLQVVGIGVLTALLVSAP